jgi:spoIIIJ-associated protein
VISDSWRKDGFGMNGSIRVSAKTVEDAITEASIQLGITSDKLEYEVIEKGSAGFLGIGMKQAVIEARRKVDEKQETEIVEEVKKEIQQVAAEEVKAEEKILEEVKAEIEHDEKPKQTTEKVEKKEEIKNDAPVKREVELAEVTDETKEAVSTFLKDTLKAMGMEVEIALDIDEDGSLSINMSGPNMGILIGKRGQTLDSLQYLANRVANKHQSGYVRVKLDTENYRARREETLKHLAKNIAHKVKRNRRPVALEPMNPYERRIIHSALQNDPYVTTHSEGEEPYRKVVVTLKK